MFDKNTGLPKIPISYGIKLVGNFPKIDENNDGFFNVGIHIADVSHFFDNNSLINKEAEKRATSVYLVDRTIPMLPEKLSNSVAASDAFFPFSDGIEKLIETGVKAIIQPGGSINDKKVIQAANNAGIVMVFTGTRHFKH